MAGFIQLIPRRKLGQGGASLIIIAYAMKGLIGRKLGQRRVKSYSERYMRKPVQS